MFVPNFKKVRQAVPDVYHLQEWDKQQQKSPCPHQLTQICIIIFFLLLCQGIIKILITITQSPRHYLHIASFVKLKVQNLKIPHPL